MSNTVILRRFAPQNNRYLACLLAMFIFIVGCGSNDDLKLTTSATTSEPDPPSQTGYDVRMNFSNEGVVRAVLTARRVRTYDSRRQTILDSSLKVDFYSPKAYHTNLLTARRALIDDRTKNMIAYDSVRTKSDHGVLVETDSLVWDNMTRQIRSDAFVRITEKNGRITTGYGFESDQDLINYRIKRPTITAPRSSIENINASSTLSPSMQTTTGTTLPLVSPPAESDSSSK
jgi:LPS export ABC transporter protein LptC